MQISSLEIKKTVPVPSANSSSLRPLWLVLIYLVLFVYLHSFSEYGLNVWDEGGYANGTLRTLNGEKAMEDFNPSGYFPGAISTGDYFLNCLESASRAFALE